MKIKIGPLSWKCSHEKVKSRLVAESKSRARNHDRWKRGLIFKSHLDLEKSVFIKCCWARENKKLLDLKSEVSEIDKKLHWSLEVRKGLRKLDLNDLDKKATPILIFERSPRKWKAIVKVKNHSILKSMWPLSKIVEQFLWHAILFTFTEIKIKCSLFHDQDHFLKIGHTFYFRGEGFLKVKVGLFCKDLHFLLFGYFDHGAFLKIMIF